MAADVTALVVLGDRDAPRRELLRDELRSVAVLRLAFAAHDDDAITGFPPRFKGADTALESLVEAALLVIDLAIWSIVIAILGPSTELATHEDIPDPGTVESPSECVP